MVEKQTPPRRRTPPPRKTPAATPAAKTTATRRVTPKAAAAKTARPARLIDRIDWEHVRERLTEYARLARMDRPVGALLLLWPTGWALWLGAHDFSSIGF